MPTRYPERARPDRTHSRPSVPSARCDLPALDRTAPLRRRRSPSRRGRRRPARPRQDQPAYPGRPEGCRHVADLCASRQEHRRDQRTIVGQGLGLLLAEERLPGTRGDLYRSDPQSPGAGPAPRPLEPCQDRRARGRGEHGKSLVLAAGCGALPADDRPPGDDRPEPFVEPEPPDGPPVGPLPIIVHETERGEDHRATEPRAGGPAQVADLRDTRHPRPANGPRRSKRHEGTGRPDRSIRSRRNR